MSQKLTEGKIRQSLDWAYDKVAVSGVPGSKSAQELAEDYLSNDKPLHEQANSLIRWQIAKAGTSGFVTGLGGLLTMPVAIPADLAFVWYVQIRMIAAIAYMGGHDLKNDKVRTLVYVCLAGNSAIEIIKDLGIVFGTKLTTQAIKQIPGKTIIAINQQVGFRLLTKFGEKGVVNLGKFVPLAGAIVGATFGSVPTKIMGNVARDTFIQKK